MENLRSPLTVYMGQTHSEDAPCSYAVFATIHEEVISSSPPLRGRIMVNGDGKEQFSKVM